ncbi:hypothetical protein C8Q77DRAFT_1067210 [Trametes polyzona]|nr:hypothetical protein C8Q77DRAFT_1067210 [Trametes polyzona]
MSLVGRAGGSVPPVGTPLPLSANLQESRPEIGGSFGGFIAVVVVLAVIFLSSCIGIFFLLRNHDPTPYERRLRRARARERDFSSEAPIGPPGIRERLARLFGRRSAGWIKASEGDDGDEWDASEDRIPNAFASLRERDRAHDEYPASFVSSAGPGSSLNRPRAEDVARSLSSESVEVELSAPSAAYSAPARSPGPSSLLESGSLYEQEPAPSIRAAPVSRPVSQPPPSLLSPPEPEFGTRDLIADERRFSVPAESSRSGGLEPGRMRSMRKFENGTKFKESL